MKNKCAIITGASKSIGKAIAIQVALDYDYYILVHYNNDQQGAKDTLSKIKENGGCGELIQFDIGKKDELLSALNIWEKDNPDKLVEVVVNNAGITSDNLFMWLTEKNWSSVIDVNLNGFYYLTQFFTKKMIKNNYGRILNMTSLSGISGNIGQVNYAASKGGIIAATKSLAQELGRRNITVNAIAPGFIESEMIKDIDVSMVKKNIPCRRIGQPEEVGYLASFLISKNASYITGEVININGGTYM